MSFFCKIMCLVTCKARCYTKPKREKRGVDMTVREEIEKLKKEKNAVILAHYYVSP